MLETDGLIFLGNIKYLLAQQSLGLCSQNMLSKKSKIVR